MRYDAVSRVDAFCHKTSHDFLGCRDEEINLFKTHLRPSGIELGRAVETLSTVK
jgi:hypothetical protein